MSSFLYQPADYPLVSLLDKFTLGLRPSRLSPRIQKADNPCATEPDSSKNSRQLAAAGLTLGFIGWLYIPRSAFYWHYGDQLLGGIVAGLAIAILTDRQD